MTQNDTTYRQFLPDINSPTREDSAAAARSMQALDIPWVESIDISNALLFLASDKARYITGVALPVDGGFAPSERLRTRRRHERVEPQRGTAQRQGGARPLAYRTSSAALLISHTGIPAVPEHEEV